MKKQQQLFPLLINYVNTKYDIADFTGIHDRNCLMLVRLKPNQYIFALACNIPSHKVVDFSIISINLPPNGNLIPNHDFI